MRFPLSGILAASLLLAGLSAVPAAAQATGEVRIEVEALDNPIVPLAGFVVRNIGSPWRQCLLRGDGASAIRLQQTSYPGTPLPKA